MGYYIETPGNRGKAQYLVANHGGRIVSYDEAKKIVNYSNNGEAVIVVVDNRMFEAAGFAYEPSEFDAFTLPDDPRPKTFVAMLRKDAERLSGWST